MPPKRAFSATAKDSVDAEFKQAMVAVIQQFAPRFQAAEPFSSQTKVHKTMLGIITDGMYPLYPFCCQVLQLIGLEQHFSPEESPAKRRRRMFQQEHITSAKEPQLTAPSTPPKKKDVSVKAFIQEVFSDVDDPFVLDQVKGTTVDGLEQAFWRQSISTPRKKKL